MSDLEKGLSAFYSQDYTTALSLLQPITDEGNAEAQCAIANIYHLGLGVERNILEAIKWYVKSSDRGYAVASNNLAVIYLFRLFLVNYPAIPGQIAHPQLFASQISLLNHYKLVLSPELLAPSPFPYTNSPLAIIIDLPPTFTSIPLAPWCAFNSSKEGLPISYPCSTLISIAFSPK